MAQAPVQPFSDAELRRLTEPAPVLPLFAQFLQDRLRQGLTEALRETAEREIKRVVDEAVGALEAQIRTFHDISKFAGVYDIIIRTKKDL